jgi:ATP phosphoribosyltransferase
MLSVALPKGRLGDKVYRLLESVGYGCPELLGDSRKLVFENEENGVRYFLVKPSDVPIYVENGAADIGVAGRDILLEYSPVVHELLDLGIGKCRMAVAAKEGFRDDPTRPLRVATKFVEIAKRHYANKNREIEIIKLYGSIELAPLLDLSDVIVDIVETGTTIKENDLEIVEAFKNISARLIANKASFKFKNKEITEMTEKLRQIVSQNDR